MRTSNKMMKNNRKGQEEMVGFGVIVGIVAIILLIFLYFALTSRPKDTLSDYKTESFLGAIVNYNTECQNIQRLNMSVRKLILACDRNIDCENGQNSCQVLTTTIDNLLEKGWQGEGEISGYVLNITADGREVINIQKGNNTGDSKGALFAPSGNPLVELKLKIYLIT